MEGFQITAKNAIERIEKKEAFESVNNLRIKITKLLFIEEDFKTLTEGDAAFLPIIPGRVAVGKVAEINTDNVYDLKKGDRVFLHPVSSCNKCYECTKGNYKHCSDFQIAGKTTDGYLKNFAIKSFDDISILPSTVSDADSVFIAHLAIADNIIDYINLQKGERVVIVGADVLGIILAQLVIYYQGVPILIDSNKDNLDVAKNCGIYYTEIAQNSLASNVAAITGNHMAKKVVYMTGSNLNTDIAIKLASNNAIVCFAGFASPGLMVNFKLAHKKQLQLKCAASGFDHYNSAINLFANKAIDTSVFNVEAVKMAQSPDKIKQKAQQKWSGLCDGLLLINAD